MDYRLPDSTLNRAVVAYMNIDDNDLNLSEEAIMIHKENTNGTLSNPFLYIMREGTRDEKLQLLHEDFQFYFVNSEEEIRIPEGNKFLKVEEWGELVDKLLDVDMYRTKKIDQENALDFIRGINFSDATPI